MLPPYSVTGKVYCFPRVQLIFSYVRRVIYHSKSLSQFFFVAPPTACTESHHLSIPPTIIKSTSNLCLSIG